MIEEDLYGTIVRVLPIACVDIVVRVRDRGYLLVRRAQEPLKGSWWVVGGRILHGERAVDAAVRKLLTEAGVEASPGDLDFLGYYEDEFEASSLGPGRYHTLSLVYAVTLDDVPHVALDSSSYEWTLADELPARLVVQSPGPASLP